MQRSVNGEPALGETATDDVAFAAQAAHRQAEFPAQFIHGLAAAVPQFDVLEVPPDPFIGVQVWRGRREVLQMQSRSRARCKKVLHLLIAVDARPIPQHQPNALDPGPL